MSLIYHQYAKAFFDLGIQKNALNAYKDELAAVTELYKSEEAFHAFLLNPKINYKIKKQIFANVFESKVDINTLQFLMVLVDKNRIRFLPEIYADFIKLYDQKENILNITVTSAVPLDENNLKLISDKYKVLYNSADVKITLVVDPTILGGIKVAVGDKLYDASLKEKLFRLRTVMRV